MTVYELVRASFQQLGVYDAEQPPPANKVNDGIETLNNMLDSWSADRLAMNDFDEFYFPLVVGRRVYTIGESDVASGDADGIGTEAAAAESITIDGALAADSVATMDIARQVILVSDGDESGNTFIITGTNEKGKGQVDHVTGANAGNAYSDLLFKTVTSITMTAIADAVTAGSATVLNMQRPNRIMWANIKTSSAEDPLGIIARTRMRELTGLASTAAPENMYYNRGINSGSLWFDNIPDATDLIKLDLWQPFRTYLVSERSTDILLPKEFLRALKYNLAIELAPEYGAPVPEWLASRASESRAFLRALNSSSVASDSQASPKAVVNEQVADNTN
ncbi:MAG: hypothetical protein KOO63_05555 [Bacteroidales bacterium]|nr:hypothetical protein [Candidatus Latescibacterota bacterium]